MRMLDLFSGIGGFALAAEWVWKDELEIVGFCEIEDYAQKILKKNFPNVSIYEDITKLDGNKIKNIDLLTGGFPCQDISVAGKGAGIEGERSGLWSEMYRIISEVRPKYALIENVPMLIHRGLERVLCDLAKIGYDAEWQIIGADDVGAWHRRKRIWIVAYPRCKLGEKGTEEQRRLRRLTKKRNSRNKSTRSGEAQLSTKVMAYTVSKRWGSPKNKEICKGRTSNTSLYPGSIPRTSPEVSPHASGVRWHSRFNLRGKRYLQTVKKWCIKKDNSKRYRRKYRIRKTRSDIPNSSSKRLEGYRGYKELEVSRQAPNVSSERSREEIKSYWSSEPNVGRVANGVSNRVDKLKGLGNAIVPQVAETIMYRIKNAL